MAQEDITQEVSTIFQLDIPKDASYERVRARLADAIGHLILHDFGRLVQILYTLDISEKAVRQQAAAPGANAAERIADLVIERLILREKTRQQSRQDQDPGIPEDEKW